MATSKPLTLSDMPIELLIDNLFPVMGTSDIVRLSSTDKYFSMICSDEMLWKRKLESDFNFTGTGTARTSGWKFIYRGLFKPRVFVWGERSNGRLGLSKYSSNHGVPFPTELRIPEARIVNLVAGGMSFHALDSKGRVFVWGTLDGTAPTLQSDGFSEPGKRADTPVRLHLPAPVRSVSCGRLHSSCLDQKNRIWTFTNWGRPFYLSSNLLTDPNLAPLQVECGWGFSSLLTKSGDVFVWWPFSGAMGEAVEAKNNEMDQVGDKKATLTADGVIPCIPWDVNIAPFRLPSIPILPELPSTGKEQKPLPQLIQIAGFDRHIVGLTDNGHVLKFGPLDNIERAGHASWEYLPKFSEISRVKEHPAFVNEDDDSAANRLTPPEAMHITHISANFLHFIAYSTGGSSIVLMGDTDTMPQSEPKIIPALQNRDVILVVLGDYHNAALTATGRLLTWGAYSAGALGLGDPRKLEPGTPGGFETLRDRVRATEHGGGTPPDVSVPTEVRFDHGRKKSKDRFCFSATAAGWHSGALVIDLEPNSDDDDNEIEEAEAQSEALREQTIESHRTWETPPIVPLPGIFRVGYAGRGGFGRGVGE
ncbi:regulator of chromosome condensation 1/beta-lactamase-inhibitor protein II [Crucibulum laeve]|uniref:Regulator of chromosome condensation 1/beta-lactamase-inhibitor protein II n=1 Tax=Crucibulum laeve TaxID=68775 RepID=A0A5C3M384_9AGAR|nr:regulator of chromosome condensation 1/beta-lactamase-inhibitor protein II [Crucibulum laeve]